MNNRFGLTRDAELRSKMPRLGPIVALGVFLAMVQPQAMAQEFFYRFTSIADTEQGPPPYALIDGFPCQNSSDDAVFEANQILNGTSIDGVFQRIALGDTGSIADTSLTQYKNFDFGMSCSINAKGVAIFTGQREKQTTTLLLLGGGGTPVQTLLSADETSEGFHRFQLNSQNTAAVLEEYADGGSLVLTKAPGGSQKTIATTLSNSPYTCISSVSINSAGTVAFVATLRDGSEGIFTVSENGLTQVLTGSSGPAAYFDDIDMNDKGSVAFDGHTLDGTPGVWRIDSGGGGYPPVLTEIADGNALGASEFIGVSINSSGQVAYGFYDETMTYGEVGLGTGSRFSSFLGPGPIVLRPYLLVLGRMVYSGFIDQDALNDLGHIVMRIVFLDNSEMIARAEIVDNFLNPLPPIEEFALSTGTGTTAGVHTSVNLPPRALQLAFDATFLSTQGELKVMLGDKLLKSVTASSRGFRQSIRVPIDLRPKGRPSAAPVPQELKFQLTGKRGTVAQIGNIRIPEAHLNWNPQRKNSRWHFDTQGGAWGGLVETKRFPVEIKVLSPEAQNNSSPAHAVSVAVLSTKSFDATKDIDRETLHFAGMPVLSERDAKGSQHPHCTERVVSSEQHPDLVCEFETPAAPAGGAAQKPTPRLEGMTPYGWSVEGRAN
jgi:hypothetical protein